MGNRLLLADDSITIQKVVAIIFANEEFELTVVDNGTAALRQAREVRPDVMLVDALMPGMTGYEVCAEIRRDPSLNSTPILLLVGAFDPFDEGKAHDCGADAFITKPFESQQLIDRVKGLLELGQSRAVPPAPAAKPLPIESAAEELWGDLTSSDTMLPPVAPVSSPAPALPVAAGHPAAADGQIVEASYEDDLWGAFEPDEAPEVAAPANAADYGVFEPESEPEPEFECGEFKTGEFKTGEFEAEEYFSFEDESEAIEETGPELDFAASVEEPLPQPSADELFGFADQPPSDPAPSSGREPDNSPSFEPFSFEPKAAAAYRTAPGPPPAAAPLVPAPQPEAASAPLFPPQVPIAAPVAAHPVSFALTEADLAAALSKISREVIERIVWEVVPDLAQLLIQEEIRKLKAGLRD